MERVNANTDLLAMASRARVSTSLTPELIFTLSEVRSVWILSGTTYT